MTDVKLGIYRHYKGKLYRVIGVALHSETLGKMVVYQALYDSEEFGDQALWVRPLKMFVEEVAVEGVKIERFKYMRT